MSIVYQDWMEDIIWACQNLFIPLLGSVELVDMIAFFATYKQLSQKIALRIKNLTLSRKFIVDERGKADVSHERRPDALEVAGQQDGAAK